jgi:hypothetical protein
MNDEKLLQTKNEKIPEHSLRDLHGGIWMTPERQKR